MEKLYTRQEAAEIMGITERALTYVRTSGKIRAVGIGASKWPEWRYSAEAIDRYMAGLEPREPAIEEPVIEVVPREVDYSRLNLPEKKVDEVRRLSPEAIKQAAKLLE